MSSREQILEDLRILREARKVFDRAAEQAEKELADASAPERV